MIDFIRENLLDKFQFEGDPIYVEPFGCGHINATFAVYFKSETRPPRRYILQRINTNIFCDPDGLMENIVNVTAFLRKKIIAAGGDPDRETLTVIFTRDGKPYYRDAEGRCWRAYGFIENATSYQSVERPVLFYNAARAFGKFQRLLADYPAATLHETIPQFHDTGKRFRDFCAAVQNDKAGRKSLVADEISFVLAREKDCTIVTGLIAAGKMPLRVTHNDTKLNNIMMDNQTDEGICIIDLDTIMPGSPLYDFGDSIRFGASSAAEDEKDLDKVFMKLDLFESYTKGFLSEVGSALTETELEYLAFSAKL
ncbi:MAG: aminoglycoside phosphotransferase family protein, partial [Firmicutes bacterium]|nr:aminoglycoside phosphotransferase family protein [Bacillota bacterium]